MSAAIVHANEKLPDAIRDAQILLAYAAESGIDLNTDVIKTIVDTGSKIQSGPLNESQESAFWVALNTLSKALCPVSVASLRATMDTNVPDKRFLQMSFRDRSGRSLARIAVLRYTRITFFTLLTLLIFQIYWLFGSSVTADISKINTQIVELEQKTTLQTTTETQSPGAKAKSDDAPTALVTSARAKAQIETLRQQKQSAYSLLRIWGNPWAWLFLQPHAPAGDAVTQRLQRAQEDVALVQTTRIVLEIHQRYILPLLYGLLGTCVFVLRTLTSDIRARIYSETSNIGFRIRLYLGTLSGMVIAWFVTPETTGELFKSLSPFALAFLAGYGVELLFAAMDRILEAFNSKPGKPVRQN